MTVKEMIDKLSKFDGNCEIVFQYFDEFGHDFVSWESTENAMDIYKDEEGQGKHKVVIDLGNF